MIACKGYELVINYKNKWVKRFFIASLLYPFWGGFFSGAYTFFYGKPYIEKVIMVSLEERESTGKRFASGYSDLIIYTAQGNSYRIDTSLLDKTTYIHRDKIDSSHVDIIVKKNNYNFLQVAQNFLIFDLKIENQYVINKHNSLTIYFKRILFFFVLVSPILGGVLIWIKITKYFKSV
jgi:hypothetical protein